jgi:hypothetical protein
MKPKSSITLMSVDPGERWTGWARLQLGRRRWTAWHGLIDGHQHPGLFNIVRAITSMPADARIAESYQLRPVLHQAFKGGATLRLLGALQYATEQQGQGWHEVPPDNPNKLNKMPMAKVLEELGHYSVSKHTLSAWRIMMQWMMFHLPERAMQLQQWSQRTSRAGRIVPQPHNSSFTWLCLPLPALTP